MSVARYRPRDALAFYGDRLFGPAPAGALAEIRYRKTGAGQGMGQLFVAVEDFRRLALPRILATGQQTDVYVGVAPRTKRAGGRDAIETAHVLWADCDGPDAVDALRAFRPLPSIVVRSGTPGHLHAYWPLRSPAAVDQVERANRRLAHHLGADMRATDAARILRPPGTPNHKHAPPAPVEAVYMSVATHELERIVDRLPDPKPAQGPRRPVNRLRNAGDDRLLTIPAAEYVEMLTGGAAGRDGKVTCPFHDDRTPSLHVYDGGDFYCFGCEVGGTIIDFGAALYGLEPRGDSYREIRQRLAHDLFGETA